MIAIINTVLRLAKKISEPFFLSPDNDFIVVEKTVKKFFFVKWYNSIGVL